MSEVELADGDRIAMRALVKAQTGRSWTSKLTCSVEGDTLACPSLGITELVLLGSDEKGASYSVMLTEFDDASVAGACTPTEFEPTAMYQAWWGTWYESANDDDDCNTECQSRGYASGSCSGVTDYTPFIGAGLGPTLHCICVTPGGNEHQVDMADPDPGIR